MPEHHDKTDRRTFLRLMSAAAAPGLAASMAGRPWGAPSSVRAACVAQSGIDPFVIQVSDEELEELHRRLAMTRWARRAPGEAWALGTDRAYLEELIAYWRDKYEWRVHEAALNKFDHYTTTIEGQLIHFVHQKGRGTSSVTRAGSAMFPYPDPAERHLGTIAPSRDTSRDA